jgi:plastocyanin
MKEHDSHRALDFALESVKHMRMHLSCLLISWLVFGNGVVSQTKTHIIKVNPGGGTTLRFDPETLIASVGSTIIWTFYPMNHSVVRADVKTPCKHLALNPKYSGFVPVSDTEHPIDMSMKLESSLPFWYYCGKDDHCGRGMVGVNQSVSFQCPWLYNVTDQPESSPIHRSRTRRCGKKIAPVKRFHPCLAAFTDFSRATRRTLVL